MSTATPTPRDSTTAKAPQLRGWVEVFRAGTHTDSKGREFNATTDDLDQIVANQQLGRAPAVLGHPKDNDPAYAWVDGLKRDGESLFAKFADINPAFDDGVALGAYRNRSIKIVRDRTHGLRLWHVGWLGAQPPAIDGLSPSPVQFSADELDEDYEFSAVEDDAAASLAWAIASVGGLLRGLREHVISQDGLDVADRVLPSWQIDSVVNNAESARVALLAERDQATAFTHPSNSGDPLMPNITLTPEQLEEKLAAARREAEDAAAVKFSAQGAELAELRATRQREAIDTHINGWKAKGLVLPAHESGLAEFMAAIDAGAEFTFSAAGAEAKKSPLEWFVEFMAGRDPVVKLGKQTSAGDGNDQVDLTDATAVLAAAREFQASEAKSGRNVSIELAVDKVREQQGQLG